MNASSEIDAEASLPDEGVPTYAYKPNLVGAPWVFSLTDKGLAWEYGRRSGLVPYEAVQRVRMSFRPATLQSHRFLTEIWSPHGPKLQIASTTFRSLMEQARQDTAYREFITELHKRFAAADVRAQFENGMHPVLYWIGALVFAAIAVGLAGFLGRTLWMGDWTGVAVIVGIAALFAWQVGMLLYRNRPGTYRPDALPAPALPRR